MDSFSSLLCYMQGFEDEDQTDHSSRSLSPEANMSCWHRIRRRAMVRRLCGKAIVKAVDH